MVLDNLVADYMTIENRKNRHKSMERESRREQRYLFNEIKKRYQDQLETRMRSQRPEDAGFTLDVYGDPSVVTLHKRNKLFKDPAVARSKYAEELAEYEHVMKVKKFIAKIQAEQKAEADALEETKR